jgi:hypothetical protein
MSLGNQKKGPENGITSTFTQVRPPKPGGAARRLRPGGMRVFLDFRVKQNQNDDDKQGHPSL